MLCSFRGVTFAAYVWAFVFYVTFAAYVGAFVLYVLLCCVYFAIRQSFCNKGVKSVL